MNKRLTSSVATSEALEEGGLQKEEVPEDGEELPEEDGKLAEDDSIDIELEERQGIELIVVVVVFFL